MMEIGVLRFDGSHAAGDALQDIIDAHADRNPWLHEIGVVSRPLLGRLRISASFLEGRRTLKEGDLADAMADLGAYTGYYVSTLAGPLGSMFATVNASIAAGDSGREIEGRLFHVDEIKQQLPRDSSALVLIATAETIDKMVSLFESYQPRVIRRDLTDEVRNVLEALHRRVVEEVVAPGAPATH